MAKWVYERKGYYPDQPSTKDVPIDIDSKVFSGNITTKAVDDEDDDPIVIVDGRVAQGDSEVLAQALNTDTGSASSLYQFVDPELDCWDVGPDDRTCARPGPDGGNEPLDLDGSRPHPDSPKEDPEQPDPVDENPKCNGLGTKKYIAEPHLADIIKEFCDTAKKQGAQDPGSGSLVRKYFEGTNEEISLAIDWVPGQKIDLDKCVEHMNVISGSKSPPE